MPATWLQAAQASLAAVRVSLARVVVPDAYYIRRPWALRKGLHCVESQDKENQEEKA
ncbi:hypothetical protein BGX27_001763, partial [Mortierella sp. AM989]